MCNIIQTFVIDKTAVNGADAVFYTGSNLYFNTIPTITNNISGINSPGVTAYLCMLSKGIPDPSQKLVGSAIRVKYANLSSSIDASVSVAFNPINGPIRINTGQKYGIVVMMEDPGFKLWTNVIGETLVDSSNISTGVTNQGIGNYYEYTGDENIKALLNTTLKFDLNIAQFTQQSANISLIPQGYEFLNLTSSNNTNFMGGEIVFQDYFNSNNATEFKLQGTINVSTGNNILVGTNTNFSVFSPNDYIIIKSGNVLKNALQINSVTNSTFLTLKDNPTFSNTVAIYKKTAIGTVYKYDPLGNILILQNSNANSSVQFTSNGIGGYIVSAGGTGYNNSDYISVSGGGSSINAVANIVTNTSGGIVSTNVSNSGLHFTSNGTLRIANSTGGTSNGSGANVVVIGYGSYLVGSISGVSANLANVYNYNVHQFDAQILTMVPATGIVSAQHDFSTGANLAVVNSNFATTTLPGMNLLNYSGMVMSRSNEVLNTANLYNSNNSAVINMTIENTSNGTLFDSPLLYDEKLDVFVLTNRVNNSSVNEFLPQGGNAISRHITTQISFANNVYAEDLIVYVDAYKPPNTNILVYAKIYNSVDPDAFSSKYWTPLNQTDPNTSIFSTAGNPNSVLEFTYNLPSYPPVQNTITGFITCTNNSSNIVGSGTNFSTDLTVGSLIRLYNPVLSNTSYMVTMVTSITNTTFATVADPITNNSILFSGTGTTSGIALDNLLYDNTAFNDNQNFNIVRYYNSSTASFDTFNTFQLKLVFQAVANNVVPIVTGIRAIGVSA